VPITTNVVSLNPAHGEVYPIQHNVIKFVSDLRQVGGFLLVLQFPLIGTLTTRLSAEDCFRQWTKRERKDIDNLSGWFGLVYGVYHHFQQYFSYTVTVSFIGGGKFGFLM
jgi:hypothetical protein